MEEVPAPQPLDRERAEQFMLDLKLILDEAEEQRIQEAAAAEDQSGFFG